MLSMLNDDNNNNPSVVRPQSYISYALVGKFFSLSDTYLHLSIQQPQKWGSDSKYPKRAIESDKNGLAGGNKGKKRGVSGSLSLSLFTNCGNEAERFFYIYIHYPR